MSVEEKKKSKRRFFQEAMMNLRISERRARGLARLNRAMTEEPFLTFVDKASFISGVCLLLATEYVILIMPEKFHAFYLSLLGPLIAFRWISYRSQRWHYFLLDFCYFCHLILVVYLALVAYTGNAHDDFFQIIFAFANGPLIWSIPAWKNSLVFHDVDKLTSMAIHIFPALVTYCLRWGERRAGGDLSLSYSIAWPLALYAAWQAMYLFLTEVVRKDKIQRCGYMTSLRWLSEERPHPLLTWTVQHGYTIKPLSLLVATQLVYTVVTLLPVPLVLVSRFANLSLILALFVMAIWNGACFYFDAFAKVYAKRVAAQEVATPKTQAATLAAESKREDTPQSSSSDEVSSEALPRSAESSAAAADKLSDDEEGDES